ncbi:MAG: Beta-glucosidase B [Chlamydiae bacterium]|nr:Beta-glucosidase B [Chlamydiota bacterium]
MILGVNALNIRTWEALEESLVPLRKDSKEWRIFHYLPAMIYFPAGLVTLALDSIGKVFSYAASFFSRDKRDPNKDFTAILDDSRKWKELRQSEVSFDSDFLFGTATCTYQDSGAVNCPDSQWAKWEKKVVRENNRSGKSADLFQLYQSDEGRNQIINRLKKLGLNSYRFSIEWSQIEPKEGVFDETKLQVYVNFCKALRKNGIAPMVTLHHFSEPDWFHKKGSFEKEENIEHFIRFAEKVFLPLTQEYKSKPLVEHICTINEPAVEAFSRYVRGAFSPGYICRFNKAGQFLKGALKANCIAYEKLKALNPRVQIGIVHQRLAMIATNPLLQPTVRYINRLVNDTTLRFFKTGIFSYKIPLCAHIREEGLNPKTDFVGLQYYTRPVIGLTGSTSYHEPMTAMPFREDPEGLYEASLEVYDAFKVPIIITENGISTHDPKQRERYLARALYATYRAQQKIGVENLRGYHYWSFCENAEWDMGLHPQSFGAYGLNTNGTLAPNPREGMMPLIQVAKNRSKVILKVA